MILITGATLNEKATSPDPAADDDDAHCLRGGRCNEVRDVRRRPSGTGKNRLAPDCSVEMISIQSDLRDDSYTHLAARKAVAASLGWNAALRIRQRGSVPEEKRRK